MPATYEPIASITLGSPAADIDFSSIPATFTDLILVNQIGQAANTGVIIRVNGDSSSVYSVTRLSGDGSAAASQRRSGQSQWYVPEFLVLTADVNAVSIVNFMSYANTNVFKTILYSDARAASGVVRTVGLWRSTSAITSIKVASMSTGVFAAGSTFALYGIRSA